VVDVCLEAERFSTVPLDSSYGVLRRRASLRDGDSRAPRAVMKATSDETDALAGFLSGLPVAMELCYKSGNFTPNGSFNRDEDQSFSVTHTMLWVVSLLLVPLAYMQFRHVTPVSRTSSGALPRRLERACWLGAWLCLGLVGTPLSLKTYQSWGKEHLFYIECAHYMAMAVHFLCFVLCARLESPTIAVTTLLLAGCVWDLKIHLLSSLGHQIEFLSDSGLFAMMDLSFNLALTYAVLGPLKQRHPLVVAAAFATLIEHVFGVVGTSGLSPSARGLIVWLYPNTIQHGAQAAELLNGTGHSVSVSQSLEVLFGRSWPVLLLRELLFHSDLLTSLFLYYVACVTVVLRLARKIYFVWHVDVKVVVFARRMMKQRVRSI